MGMMTTIEPAALPALLVEGDRPMADSLDVARVFGKRHDNVCRDVANLLRSEEIEGRAYFQSATYLDARGRPQIRYLMTRDGFSMLAMGFTGPKAVRWKVAYIEAFNRLEAHYRAAPPAQAPAAVDPRQFLADPRNLMMLLGDYARALDAERASHCDTSQQLDNTSRALTVQTNLTRALDRDLGAARGRIEAIQPKALAFDRLASTSGSSLISDVAKDLGLNPGKLFAFLDTQSTDPTSPGWIYRRKEGGDWICAQRAIDLGLVEQVIEEVTLPDGRNVTRRQARVTDKGRARLSEILSHGRIQPRLEL